MANTYWLSVNTLKEESTLDSNIEDKLIKSSIIDGQEIDIQSILGTRLFNKISTDIDGATVSGVYKTLLDNYITPALIKFSERRALLYIWIKIRNKSVISEGSEYGNTVDMEMFNMVRRDLLDSAEYFSNRLKLYLIEEVDNYPEYKNWNSDTKCYNVKPNKNDSFFCGIQL